MSPLGTFLYALAFAIVVGLIVGLVNHFTRVSREKYNQQVREQRQREQIEADAKAKADAGAADRDKKRAAFLRGLDGFTQRLHPRSNPLLIWSESRGTKFPFVVLAFAETLPDARREEMEREIEEWRTMTFPIEKLVKIQLTGAMTPDYSEGTEKLRRMFARLRAFAE